MPPAFAWTGGMFRNSMLYGRRIPHRRTASPTKRRHVRFLQYFPVARPKRGAAGQERPSQVHPCPARPRRQTARETLRHPRRRNPRPVPARPSLQRAQLRPRTHDTRAQAIRHPRQYRHHDRAPGSRRGPQVHLQYCRHYGEGRRADDAGAPVESFAAEFLDRHVWHWNPWTLESDAYMVCKYILPTSANLTVESHTVDHVKDVFASKAALWGYRSQDSNPCKNARRGSSTPCSPATSSFSRRSSR